MSLTIGSIPMSRSGPPLYISPRKLVAFRAACAEGMVLRRDEVGYGRTQGQGLRVPMSSSLTHSLVCSGPYHFHLMTYSPNRLLDLPILRMRLRSLFLRLRVDSRPTSRPSGASLLDADSRASTEVVGWISIVRGRLSSCA